MSSRPAAARSPVQPSLGESLRAFDSRGRPAVTWSVLAAPWGPVHVAVGPGAIVAVALRSTDEEFVAALRKRGFAAERSSPPRAGDESGPSAASPAESAGSPADGMLERATARIERYIGGDAAAVDLAPDLPVDLSDRPAWDRAVLEAVRRIPAGAVSSYGGIARTIGRTGAARAVGGAVGRNPIALFVPCHRVIAGDGSIGGYGGSWFGSREENLLLKRGLLELEGIELPARPGI